MPRIKRNERIERKKKANKMMAKHRIDFASSESEYQRGCTRRKSDIQELFHKRSPFYMLESSQIADPPRMPPKPTTTTVAGVLSLTLIEPSQKGGRVSAAATVALMGGALHAPAYA